MNVAKKITPLVALGGMVASVGLMEEEVQAQTLNKEGTVTANLNVRSSNSTSSPILKTLPKGTKVKIIEEKNGWYKITSGNTTGWVSTSYVQLTTSSSSSSSGTTSTTKTGKTTANLNVRSSNSTSSSILKTLPKGTSLTILEEKNGWYKIKLGNTTGWVSASYIQLTTSSSSNPSGSTSATKTGKTTANLNVRSSNSTSSSILKTLPKGTSVTITEEKNGWYKITSGNTTGWVSAQYIQLTAGGNSNSDTGTATRQGQTTANLNVRSSNSTSSSILKTLPKGTSLTILEEKNGWYKIKSGNTTGWVSSQYVQLTTGGNSNNDTGTATRQGQTTSNLNVRTSNSTSSSVLTVLSKGTIVTIVEEKGGWYKIKSGNVTGWVSSQYVQLITGGGVSNNGGSDKWGIMGRYNIPSVAEGNKTKYMDIITSISETYGVPVALIQKIIEAESNFQNNAVSPAGAQGLMQLMPATATSLGVTDPFDPAQNINGGVKYISQHLNTYNGDLVLALAAYNAGAGNVSKYGGVPPFPETINYIKKITGIDVSERYPS